MLGWLLNLGFAGGSVVVVTPDEIITFTAAIQQTESFDAAIRQTQDFNAAIQQTETFDADTL